MNVPSKAPRNLIRCESPLEDPERIAQEILGIYHPELLDFASEGLKKAFEGWLGSWKGSTKKVEIYHPCTLESARKLLILARYRKELQELPPDEFRPEAQYPGLKPPKGQERELGRHLAELAIYGILQRVVKWEELFFKQKGYLSRIQKVLKDLEASFQKRLENWPKGKSWDFLKPQMPFSSDFRTPQRAYQVIRAFSQNPKWKETIQAFSERWQELSKEIQFRKPLDLSVEMQMQRDLVSSWGHQLLLHAVQDLASEIFRMYGEVKREWERLKSRLPERPRKKSELEAAVPSEDPLKIVERNGIALSMNLKLAEELAQSLGGKLVPRRYVDLWKGVMKFWNGPVDFSWADLGRAVELGTELYFGFL